MRRQRPAPMTIATLLSALLLSSNASSQAVPASKGTTWALVIGISEYKNQEAIKKLEFADTDARSVKEALIKYLGVADANIFLMTSNARNEDDKPTSENILDRFDMLKEKIRPEDTFIFYYSGHGFNRGEDKQYLATYDTNPTSELLLERRSISLIRLRDIMKNLRARQVIYLVDACRKDPAKGIEDDAMKSDFSKRLIIAAGSTGSGSRSTAVLFACSEGEWAYELPEKQHGVYTYYLLEGLSGRAAESNGEMTVYGLSNYLTDKVSEWRGTKGERQTPSLALEAAGSPKMVLKPASLVAAPPPAPPAMPPAAPANPPVALTLQEATLLNAIDAALGQLAVTLPVGAGALASPPQQPQNRPSDFESLRRQGLIPAKARPNDIVKERDLEALIQRIDSSYIDEPRESFIAKQPNAPVTRIRALAALLKRLYTQDDILSYLTLRQDELPADAKDVQGWEKRYVIAATALQWWDSTRLLQMNNPATWAFLGEVLLRMPLSYAPKLSATNAGDLQPEEGAYTGLIVDAQALQVRSDARLRILDEENNVIYPDANHLPGQSYILRNGLAAYVRPDGEARRAGPNPLTVRALRTVAETDLVVSNETAAQIKEANLHGKFLWRWNVCILVQADR